MKACTAPEDQCQQRDGDGAAVWPCIAAVLRPHPRQPARRRVCWPVTGRSRGTRAGRSSGRSRSGRRQRGPAVPRWPPARWPRPVAVCRSRRRQIRRGSAGVGPCCRGAVHVDCRQPPHVYERLPAPACRLMDRPSFLVTRMGYGRGRGRSFRIRMIVVWPRPVILWMDDRLSPAAAASRTASSRLSLSQWRSFSAALSRSDQRPMQRTLPPRIRFNLNHYRTVAYAPAPAPGPRPDRLLGSAEWPPPGSCQNAGAWQDCQPDRTAAA
jgi:hypothetical protein